MQFSARKATAAAVKRSSVGQMPRIAVVDDDDGMRRLLRNLFESSGYNVSEARDEAELMTVLKAQAVALITLDLSLRLDDGLAIARSVRALSDVPIVMVTARADDIDRIVGLELGADDYITKPFNIREVLARVRAVLRRADTRSERKLGRQQEVVQFANWILDFAARELKSTRGRARDLTSAEFRLLEAFVRHSGRVLTRDFLIDAVGGVNAEPLERSIDTIVGRLRKKIEQNAARPQIIKTVRGAGYIFAARIRD